MKRTEGRSDLAQYDFPRDDLTIVIVTYNSAEVIRECLASCQACFPGAEVVVVDNGSTDERSSYVEAFPGVRVLAGHGNVGFGAGCNLGAKMATRALILFMNPDVRLASLDAIKLDEALNVRPFGLLAPASRMRFGRPDAPIHADRHWFWGSARHILVGFLPRELQPLWRIGGGRGSDWVSGACFLTERSEFLSLGGFSASYFLYYEDRELSLRYRRAGLPLRSTVALVVEHIGNASSGSSLSEGERPALSLLGWLQYLAERDGFEVAVRAARFTYRMSRTTLAALSIVERGMGQRSRIARKRGELQALVACCDSAEARVVRGSYPAGIEALRAGRA